MAPRWTEELRGTLLEHPREARVGRGWPLARWACTLLLGIAFLPVGLVSALCLIPFLLIGAWILFKYALAFGAARGMSRERETPADDGQAFVVKLEDQVDAERTVLVRGRLIGPVAPGNRVRLRVFEDGEQTVLSVGFNDTQGGRLFRGDLYPWPHVLVVMLAWYAAALVAWQVA